MTKPVMLSIHRSNIFLPKPLGITTMAYKEHDDLLVLTRVPSIGPSNNRHVNLIEFYKKSLGPYTLIRTIVEKESITGIEWLNQQTILTVSKQQNINVYDMKSGTRIKSVMTDFGAILTMKFDKQNRILLNGTEYGYVSAYKIGDGGSSVDLISRLTKLSSPIVCLDYVITKYQQPQMNEVSKAKITSPTFTKKRKRKDSSDDSDIEDDVNQLDETKNKQHELVTDDITIFAGSKGDLIVLDYQKKTIIETIRIGTSDCCVRSVLVLSNGDSVVGDSKGNVTIIDKNTLTCRQTIKVLEADILCIATDRQENFIRLSGRDPTIVHLKKDNFKKDQFNLFEKTEFHGHPVTSLISHRKNQYFTASMDGLLVEYRRNPKVLRKFINFPSFQNRIKFYEGQMMTQYDNYIDIWKLPKASLCRINGDEEGIASFMPSTDDKPTKAISFKAKDFIYCSAFDDKHIVYSSAKGLRLYNRDGNGRVTLQVSDDQLGSSHLMEICHGTNLLALCRDKILLIIDLKSQLYNDNETTSNSHIVAQFELDAMPESLNFLSKPHVLVVSKAGLNLDIECFKIEQKSPPEQISKFKLKHHKVKFLYTPPKSIEKKSYINAYTIDNQLLRINVSQGIKEPKDRIDEVSQLTGVPEGSSIIGMLQLSKDIAILYDNAALYRVCLVTKKVTNSNKSYKFIMTMDNQVLDDLNQVVLAELKLEDYLSTVKPTIYKQKFDS